ncbi:MAG: hypothetical protein IT299_02430 [Dehalococcoidia bacterium]|nr:hypothetical protein [Dehalococcoidia bacterium]
MTETTGTGVVADPANDPANAPAWTTVQSVCRLWQRGENPERSLGADYPVGELLDAFAARVKARPVDPFASPIHLLVRFLTEDVPTGLGFTFVSPPSPTEIAARERERSMQIAAAGVPNSPKLERVSSVDWPTFDFMSQRAWRICRGEARPW